MFKRPARYRNSQLGGLLGVVSWQISALQRRRQTPKHAPRGKILSCAFLDTKLPRNGTEWHSFFLSFRYYFITPKKSGLNFGASSIKGWSKAAFKRRCPSKLVFSGLPNSHLNAVVRVIPFRKGSKDHISVCLPGCRTRGGRCARKEVRNQGAGRRLREPIGVGFSFLV